MSHGTSIRIAHLPVALAIAIAVLVLLIVGLVILYAFGQYSNALGQAVPESKGLVGTLHIYDPLIISLIAISLALGLLILYFVYTTIRGE